MSKFKVGDRVRRVRFDTDSFPLGFETVVRELEDAGWFRCFDKNVEEMPSHCSRWELVQPASSPSPVITKTVKEIVPGEFGGVVIEEHVKTVVHLHMLRNTFDKHELREAARIFNELADALEA